jgi:nitrous oxidase accessory protein NosD
MRGMRAVRLLAAWALALVLCTPASAAVVRVQGQAELDRALTTAPAGATLLLHAAPYASVAIHRDRVALAPAPGQRVTLGRVTVARASRVGIRGFRIRGGVSVLTGSSRVAVTQNNLTQRGLYVGQATRVRIARNRVHDLAPEQRGITLDGSNGGRGQGGARMVRIVRNRILRTTDDGIAIFWAARDVLIERNEIAEVRFLGEPHNHADAIHLAGLDDDQSGITIRHNRLHDNFYGLLAKQDGSGELRDLTLFNNLFERTETRHLDLYGVHGARVIGNTFRDSRWGVHLGEGTSVFLRGNVIDKLEIARGAHVTR